MIEVRVKENMDLEKAIQIFKRKIGREGILTDLKNKRFYDKPSILKRKKQAKAERRRRRKMKRASRIKYRKKRR